MSDTLTQNAPSPAEIARDYGGKVSNLCRRMIRDRELAEDTAQEIWFEVLKGLPSFKGESSLSTWLYTVAKRTIDRHIRNEQTFTVRFLNRFFEEHADNGMREMREIPTEDREQWFRLECDACLTAILHCLDNETRTVYLMRLLTELPYRELSLILESDPETLRQRFSRASRKINHFLNDHCTLYNPDGRCRCKIDKPIRYLDHQEEFRKIRDASRKTLSLQRAGEYHRIRNLWEELAAS